MRCHALRAVLPLLVAGGLAAQPPAPNRTDAQGRKQGPWARTWADSPQLRYTGQFKDDRPVGSFTYFATNGAVESIVDHYADGSAAHARHYHPNGRLMAEGRYVGQDKDSIWTYYGPDGGKRSMETWVKGRQHGEQLTWFSDGTLAERITYANGEQDGVHEQFFPGGQVKHRGTYVRGLGDGTFTWYHPNGVKEIEGRMVNGDRDGIWYHFLENGKVQLQLVYQQGRFIKDKKENGVFKEYCDDDQLRSEFTYVQGRLDGPFTEYHCNGTWVTEQLPADPALGGTPEVQRVLKGQSKKREGTYRNGLLNGIVTEYDTAGRVLSRVDYVDGEPRPTAP